MKYGKVIGYSYGQPKTHEKNFPTHDLELSAIVFDLKILKYCLHVVHVNVFTDHKSLQYVFTQQDFNSNKRIWLELLKDYEMSVPYHPGENNFVADALS